MPMAHLIPTLKVDEEPATGLYQVAADGLRDALLAILSEVRRGTRRRMPVPALQGHVASGRMIGSCYEVTLTREKDDKGVLLDLPIPICTTWLVLHDDDADAACRAAVHLADALGYELPHSGWLSATRDPPGAPFTIVVPNPGIEPGRAAGLVNLDQVRSGTGFFQALFGTALDEVGHEPFEVDEDYEGHEEPPELAGGTALAHAIQTGGAPQGVLIVEPAEDGGYPEVYAYVGDVELDVMRVDFQSDAVTRIDTEGLSYLMLGEDTFEAIRLLREEADEVWEEIDAIADGLDHDDIWDPQEGRPDPFARLHTKHARIEMPEALAGRISSTLGIGQRYGKKSGPQGGRGAPTGGTGT